MGKPSSSSTSLKKKRSRASSKVRIKKTSKTKKTRKSKKSSRRRHDSESYSSDYDSPSSVTASSEEDYRRRSKRRARSSSKKISRRSKKRSRGQSYSAESSEDLPSRKKRKGPKRGGKRSPRMKRTRKKSKRHVSVSSASSGSYCSTCAESSSDGGQSESQSYRASSERKDKDRWTAEKGKIELKECGYSPGSYSPISHRSISSGDEKMRSRNNSMRLRSVIMVNNEDGELHAYGHKEEITYENDDYPCCKSNDSNDSGGKRELTHHPLLGSEVKSQVDSEKDEEAVVSHMNTTAITEDSQKNGNNISSVVVGTKLVIRDNESNVSGGSDGNDLESMLRQRALENIKKFRGVHKNTAALSAQKENVDGNKKQSLIATSESSHHKFSEDNVANAPPVEGNGANSDSSVKRDFISIKSNDASLGDKGGKIVPAIRRQSSEVRPDHGRSGLKESGSTGQSVVKLLHEGTSVANVKQEVIPTFASSTSNPRVTSYTWRRESAKVQAPSKELRPSSGPPQAKPMVTKGIGGKIAIETVGTENKVNDNEVQKHASPAPELPSRSESMSGAVSSDKDGNDAKDGPQYEQKTMSVTRGGETIKVNYQVYIPKRAPALARRQLKR